MKLSVLVVAFVLLVSCFLRAADAERKHVVLDPSEARSTYPFSDAVLAGDTLYIAGTVGFDHGKVPASAEDEARLAMDGVTRVLESQGMTMDDLVSVQVFCTDFGLYEKFNAVYRTYFRQQFPARAFLGAASLIRGAHFEIVGTAIKRGK